MAKFPGMFIALTHWFTLVPNSDYFEEGGDHANEMETSVIMHYFPQLVGPLEDAGDGSSKDWKLKGLKEKIAWSPRKWDEVSADTGIGDPRKATPEKGQRFVDEVTSRIGSFIAELSECNLDDMYA